MLGNQIRHFVSMQKTKISGTQGGHSRVEPIIYSNVQFHSSCANAHGKSVLEAYNFVTIHACDDVNDAQKYIPTN